MLGKILTTTQTPQSNALHEATDGTASQSKTKRKFSSTEDCFEGPKKNAKLDLPLNGQVTPLDPRLADAASVPSIEQFTEALRKKLGLYWQTRDAATDEKKRV